MTKFQPLQEVLQRHPQGPVGSNCRHDSTNVPGLQTTGAFYKSIEKYQEVIINKIRLCNVHICYMRVRGNYKKDPQEDCVLHQQCWNKMYSNGNVNFCKGLLYLPSPTEKLQWYFLTFCTPNLDLNTVTQQEVMEFLQLQ